MSTTDSYLGCAITHPAETAAVIAHAINHPRFQGLDFIVGRGISGALILGTVSAITGLPLIFIRKYEDNTHSSQSIEKVDSIISSDGFYEYVIIDDLIFSGQTVKEIYNTIQLEMGKKCKCLGVILYKTSSCLSNSTILLSDEEIPVISVYDDIRELVLNEETYELEIVAQ